MSFSLFSQTKLKPDELSNYFVKIAFTFSLSYNKNASRIFQRPVFWCKIISSLEHLYNFLLIVTESPRK